MSCLALLVCILIGLVVYLIYKHKQLHNYWQSRGIPCDEPVWFFGNCTGGNYKRSFKEIWDDYYTKYKGTGPFAGFYWFLRPAVVVLDTTLIKNILIKDFAKFTDRGFFSNEKDDPLSGHLFLLDGQRWQHMRKKLSPVFTSGKMKFMFPTIMQVGEEFVRVFGDMVKQDAVVEVKDLLARFTTDVIGTCAFGIECNSLRDPEAEFRVMGKKCLTENRYNTLIIALMSSFPKLAKKLHMKQTPDHIEEFYLRIVRETVAHREQHGIRRNDFLDMLIDLKNNKALNSGLEDVVTQLTLEQITAQVFVFFFAGFETSSTTLGFALYELAQHEDIQQKAREEILAVLETHKQLYTYESVKEMQYLDQVISETLRLYTVASILNRECLEDYVVPDHPKYVIKKGMPIIIPAAAIHRDAQYYPNPDDFNPDNFAPELVKQRDSVEWLPFGDGPRNCIGLRFGQMQSRIGLALLLQHFKFSVCQQTQIPMKYAKNSFFLSTEGGIFLKVEKV